MSLSINYNIENITKFQKILQDNKSIIIIKFSAGWCGPCSKMKPYFNEYMKLLPNNIEYYFLDVDENEEIYSFLKKKKMINGIPAIVAYYKDNTTYIPNDIVIGFNINQLQLFFERCQKHI